MPRTVVLLVGNYVAKVSHSVHCVLTKSGQPINCTAATDVGADDQKNEPLFLLAVLCIAPFYFLTSLSLNLAQFAIAGQVDYFFIAAICPGRSLY